MRGIPAALLAAFPPSADLLLDRARRETDDAMLAEIAGADYGMMADERLAELRPIRDTGVIPAPMNSRLSEVLNLIRNCNPEMPEAPPFEPGPTGQRGHQTRLFACAVLLRADAMPPHQGTDSSPDLTLAQCLVSAGVLGEGMSEATACFITWLISRQESGSESLLLALGLLVLAIRLRPGRFAEPLLGEIAGWILEIESLWLRRFPPTPADPMPLPFSIQAGFWRPLVAELRNEAESIRENDIRTDIELCGLLLDPGW